MATRGPRGRSSASGGRSGGPQRFAALASAAPTPERILPPSNRPTPPQPTQRRRPRTHRAYGLPNANQIFLTMVVVGLLFIELLRPNWLVFNQSDATAGLSGLRLLSSVNDTATHVTWRAFCDPTRYDYKLPIDTGSMPQLEQPFPSREDAQRACASNTPETVRVLTATAIACSMLSVTVALYFHLGSPSQRQVVVLGVVPGGMLLVTGVLGTVALAVWQANFAPLDNGDCFSVAVASTVIAYVVAISMAIRWRWPGIFAVDEEQQAFEVRRTWRRRPPPPTAATSDEIPASSTSDSPRATPNTFHHVV